MRTDRDSQRHKVYAAEGSSGLNTFVQTIPDREVQDWVNGILDRRFIRSRWGVRTVQVKLTNGNGGANAWGSYKITASRGARNEYAMLHEIAHVLTPNHTGHGPEFCGVLLYLVRSVLGKEAHAKLLTAMREHRVKRSNSAIPAVRKEVPPPTKQREREERKSEQQAARFRIIAEVNRGNISWNQVIALAKEKQRQANEQKAATRKRK